MAYIEAHQSLRDHRKILTLAAALDMPEPHVAGHCLYLWLWSLDNAPEGILPSRRIVARAAGWTGDPNVFVDAMLDANLLDVNEEGQLLIHDWMDYAGLLIERRERNKLAMRAARARDKAARVQHVETTSTPHVKTVKESVDLPYPTVPYTTLPSDQGSDLNGKVINKREIEHGAVARVRSPSDDRKPQSQSRPADPLFDALHDALGYGPDVPLTKSARGWLNAAIKQLRAVGATPADITDRCAELAARFGPDIPVTPSALVKHWPKLGQGGPHGETGADAAARAARAEDKRQRAADLAAEVRRLARSAAGEHVG